jgi:hypothetical protein
MSVDCMFSVDLMVDDTVETANLLVERLGLPPLRPTWTDSTVDQLAYLRAHHPFSQAAPTLIEIIKTSPGLPATAGQSTDRPVKTHATVFVTKTYRDVVANLEAKGLRHFDMPSPGDGLSRCFAGVENLQPGTEGNTYDANVDGNIFMEIISWEGTGLATRDAIPQELGDGDITRVIARSYLVANLDRALQQLQESLQWDEAGRKAFEGSGIRFAILQPLMPASASLELIESTSLSGKYREYFSRWGVGPHAIRFGVRGLDAKAEDLTARGTRFDEDSTPAGQRVLLVDESQLDGIIVEFAEDPLVS